MFAHKFQCACAVLLRLCRRWSWVCDIHGCWNWWGSEGGTFTAQVLT